MVRKGRNIVPRVDARAAGGVTRNTGENMVKRIPVAELKPGMRVAGLEKGAWLHDPGLYTVAGLVVSREEVERIEAAGFREVVVHQEEHGTAEDEHSPSTSDGRSTLATWQELREEFSQARKVYFRALKVASQVVMNTAQGKPVDVAAVRGTVGEMLESVDTGRETLGCCARLTRAGAHLCSHLVAVTAVSLAFGSHLGLGKERLQHLGLAAFLHDIGMTRLSVVVLSGHAGLSEAEQQEIRKHPMFGVRMLQGVGGLPREVRRAVLEHHENHDGSGYPAGLSGDDIGQLTRIVHLADVYDGLTTGHVHGRPRPPAEALSRMYAMSGEFFAGEDVERFIKCMGVYPAGSMVRLVSGETAVVLRNTTVAPLAPLVKIVLEAQGERGDNRLVDLAGQGAAFGGIAEPVHDPRLQALAESALSI